MIRIARIDDLSSIVSIYNEAIEARGSTADLTPLKTEDRLEWFQEHNPEQYPIYVFSEHDSVLGWCSLSPYRFGRKALRRTAEITYYIKFNSHRRGIASQLVQHTINEAPNFGILVLFGILLDTNIGSIALMRKCGFEQWGHLPDVADFEGKLVGHLYYGRKVIPMT